MDRGGRAREDLVLFVTPLSAFNGVDARAELLLGYENRTIHVVD